MNDVSVWDRWGNHLLWRGNLIHIPRVGEICQYHEDGEFHTVRSVEHTLSDGKILASRNPDLNISYNCLITFNGWEKTHPKK